VANGEGKANLDRARGLAKSVADGISGPGYLLRLLTDQLDAGAIVSTDPVNGMSGQMAAGLVDVATAMVFTARNDADFAQFNYQDCPDEV